MKVGMRGVMYPCEIVYNLVIFHSARDIVQVWVGYTEFYRKTDVLFKFHHRVPISRFG